MNYIEMNKAAWEEAFEMRSVGWGEDNARILDGQAFPFLFQGLTDTLKGYDFAGKTVAQLCCNNGRELMSIVKGTNAKAGVGFDIAGNFIAQAKKTAVESGINCTFENCNLLEMPSGYDGAFDYAFVITGALCWFENLFEFFAQTSKSLNGQGILIINEIHPFTDMLAVPGEDIYDENQLLQLEYSYFKKEPFTDNFGMNYISGTGYKSKTFTCFSHTLGDVANAVVKNGFSIRSLTEYDTDISGSNEKLSGKGFPLSYILVAQKNDIMRRYP